MYDVVGNVLKRNVVMLVLLKSSIDTTINKYVR